MGRMAERYTEDQRVAVATAQLDRGMTAAEATSALKKGELGVNPIDMPISTAQTYRKREMKRRANRRAFAQAEKDPNEATDKAREIALGIALRELGRLQRKSRLEPGDVTALERLARLAKGLERPSKRAPDIGKPTSPGGSSVDSDFMRRLRERHGAEDEQP